MATNYGRNYRKVHLADIDEVQLLSCTNTASVDDNNGAVLSFSHPNIGCASSGFTVFLNDMIDWRYITFKIYLTGTSACWGFCQGSYAPAPTANLLAWNPSLDRVFFSKNSWELPQFQLKMAECDNDPDNFMHPSFAVGAFREFYTTRRRNDPLTRAGLSHGRACLGAGTTTISNIRVW